MPDNDLDAIIDRVYKIHPEPGDTIIVDTADSPITPGQAEQLRNALKPHFPDNQILILTELTIQVQGG